MALEGGELTENPFYWPAGDVPGWDRAERLRHRKMRLDEYRKGKGLARRHRILLGLLGALRATVHGSEAETMPWRRYWKRSVARWDGHWGTSTCWIPRAGGLEPSLVWFREMPDRFGSLVQETRGLSLERGEALPGRVLATGRAAWVTDVSEDAEAARIRGVRPEEVRSAVAVPLTVDGEVRGALELFSPTVREADPELVAVLEEIGAELGEVMVMKRMEEEVVRGRDRFQALVESAGDAIVVADHRSRVVSWNRAAAEMFGYTAEEILGEPLQSLMPDRYQGAHTEAFSAVVETGGAAPMPGRTLEVHGRAKDGREFPVELSLASWIAEGRRYFSGILRDLSARTEVEEELALLGSAVANVHDAILVTTAGEAGRGPTIIYVNPAFTHMTGFTEAEVLGRSFGMLMGPKSDPAALRELEHAMKLGEPASLEVTAYRRDGSEFLLDWHASPIREAQGARHFVSIQRDITEERVTEETLRRADRDQLTGLPNRQVLVKRLRRAIERASDRADYRYAVLFLDLDGFRRVNEVHGQIAGDQLLTSTARRLERAVRPGDTRGTLRRRRVRRAAGVCVRRGRRDDRGGPDPGAPGDSLRGARPRDVRAGEHRGIPERHGLYVLRGRDP